MEPAVFDGAMCYDAARRQYVAFGGSHRRYDADGKTHLFEGGHWREAECIWSPGARDGAAMVYDSKRQLCVLFGGQSYYSAPSNDTWEWDGRSWSPVETSNKPPARRGHAMAYDEERGVTVMYGGAKDDSSVWEYDGKDWKRRPIEIGPASRRTSMAFDKTFRVCVLFGGQPTEGHSDTWRWNGIDWSEVACKEPPTGLNWFALAWSDCLHQTILVGETSDERSTVHAYVGPRWHTIETNGPTYPLEGACLASGPRGVLLHGGKKRGSGRDDTWEFQGEWINDTGMFEGGWRDLTGPCTPRFDGDELMFYDAVRQRTCLLGSDWDEPLGKSSRQRFWQWDGHAWSEVTTLKLPPLGVRRAAFDEQRGIGVCLIQTPEDEGRIWEVWEWDGQSWNRCDTARSLAKGLYYDREWNEVFGLFWLGPSNKAEVRSWNGKRWLVRANTELPSLAGYSFIAYDAARRVLVILTEAENEKHTHATYEFDFKVLRKLDTEHAPSISCARSMVYCPAQGLVLLVGCGFDYEEQMTFDYFWTFDGADWSMPRVLTKPTPRRSPLLAYDSHRQTVVAFGGQDTWGWIYDTWEYGPDN